KYRNAFRAISFIFAIGVFALIASGCGSPAWLTDAGQIIGLVGASFASLASFVAALTGNSALAAALAVVSQWITKIQTAVTDLQALINQYQASPTPGLLGEIEAALTDVQQNIQQDFANL